MLILEKKNSSQSWGNREKWDPSCTNGVKRYSKIVIMVAQVCAYTKTIEPNTYYMDEFCGMWIKSPNSSFIFRKRNCTASLLLRAHLHPEANPCFHLADPSFSHALRPAVEGYGPGSGTEALQVLWKRTMTIYMVSKKKTKIELWCCQVCFFKTVNAWGSA